MSNGAIPPYQVAFYDSYTPPLLADDYTFVVDQKLAGGGGTITEQRATQDFSVVAPRFALDPSEIQSVFPPANSTGPYGEKLPHVVLTERALPWERLLGRNLPALANPNAKSYPWLALLVFGEDELLPPGGAAPASLLANPTMTATWPVARLLEPGDPSILGPQLAPEREDEKSCRVIDVPIDVFTRVAPRLADLPWLAHVRQVNVDAKSSSAATADGWFAVVIANRFPIVGTDPAGKRNIVHLVSLEGFAPWLVDHPVWPNQQVKAVRLASLASWSFTAHPDGLDFARLMKNLVAVPESGGADLRLRLPTPSAAAAAGTPAAQARTALQRGYAPLLYETRAGDRSFGWYHGPLVPQPVPPLAAGSSFPNSAAATIYDPDSGTFDMSYAAAWEVGRLLALHDRAYGTAQQRARKALRRTVDLARERGLSPLPAPAQAQALSAEAMLAPRQASRSFITWFGEQGPQWLKGSGTQQAAADTARATRPAPAQALRNMLAGPELQQVVRAHLQSAAEDGPVSDMVDWLARLRLLEGVPFDYLVPDARMLPPESIRFFYVDPNMLDALCDGAQSIGLQTSRDAVQQQLVRGTLHGMATARASGRRAALLGGALAATPASGDPVAGMLLRSAAVSGWPGLEVKAYSDREDTLIQPLRLDHLAPDVLLALYPEVPVWIEIEEPKEGIAFGTEDDWLVGIRHISGSDLGRQILDGNKATVTEKLDATWRRDGGVLSVDAWQAHLAGLPGLKPDAASWGPAAFALQMVSTPEQMVFYNGE